MQLLVTDQNAMAGGRIAEITSLRAIPVTVIPIDAATLVSPSAAAARPISRGAIVTDQDLNSAAAPAADVAVIAIATSSSTPHLVAGQGVLAIVNADPFSPLKPQIIEATVHEAEAERLTLLVAHRDLVVLTAAIKIGHVTPPPGN